MRALITGGTSPIGAAICRRLAQDGLHVIIHACTSVGKAHDLAEEICEAGGQAEILVCDLSDIVATRDALIPVVAGGVPQVIVHNAGTHDDVTMAGMQPAQWTDVLDVSLDGFLQWCSHCSCR